MVCIVPTLCISPHYFLLMTPGISPFTFWFPKFSKKIKIWYIYINGILQKHLKSKEPAKNQWPVLYQFFHENR
jgi:hypothetical protein